MTFKEAINSEGLVRRSNFTRYGRIHYSHSMGGIMFQYKTGKNEEGEIPITLEDVLATDWIAQEKQEDRYILSNVTFNGKQLYEKVEHKSDRRDAAIELVQGLLNLPSAVNDIEGAAINIIGQLESKGYL